MMRLEPKACRHDGCENAASRKRGVAQARENYGAMTPDSARPVGPRGGPVPAWEGRVDITEHLLKA
jgi:hypothetical protein